MQKVISRLFDLIRAKMEIVGMLPRILTSIYMGPCDAQLWPSLRHSSKGEAQLELVPRKILGAFGRPQNAKQ